jgi:hypothetical protein
MTTIHKSCSIAYQSSKKSRQLECLAQGYGDYLEELCASEKLHLLGVLTCWQAFDTELQQEEDRAYPLEKAIEDYNYDLSFDTSAALELLHGLSDESALDLMVAIAHQLKEGVFQQ